MRFILFIFVGPWQEEILGERILINDAPNYHRLAINMLEEHTFSHSLEAPFVSDVRITPVYPLFLSLAYVFYGHKPHGVILLQLIIGSLTCVMTYKIGSEVFNRGTALIAGLIMSLEYVSVSYCNHLLTETLFTFLFIVHTYFFIRFIINKKTDQLVLSALFLGIATLCRPISLFFFVVSAGFLLIHYRNTIGTGAVRSVLFVILFFMVLIPWMTRNYIVSDRFLVSTIQEEAYRWHSASKKNTPQTSDKGKDEGDRDRVKSIKKDSTSLNENVQPSTRNKFFSVTVRYVRGVSLFFMLPDHYVLPKLLGLTYYPWRYGDLLKRPFTAIKDAIPRFGMVHWFVVVYGMTFLVVLYSTICVGVYRAVKENEVISILLFILIIVYFALVSAPVAYERYRVPIMPYIVLLSSYGIVQLRGIIRGVTMRSVKR